MKMKIIITNTVALNGGDAAILIALINLIRTTLDRDAKFIIYDSKPDIASRYYPELEFRQLLYYRVTEIPPTKRFGRVLRSISRFLNPLRFYLAAWCWVHNLRLIARLFSSQEEQRDLAEYSSADLIISTGGTYLVENYNLTVRLFECKIVLLMQRPLIFFTQSLGPFLKKRNQKTLRQVFNSAILILLRDEKSQKHLEELELESVNYYVTSDAVFALADQSYLLDKCHENSPNKYHLNIAFSVRDWRYFNNISPSLGMKKYKDALRELTEYLVKKYDARVTYISTCQGIPEYVTDDSKVAVEIFESLSESIKASVEVDNKFHRPEELIETLKSYDLVVATRMHAAILSLVAGTPVFPIAYEFKTQELFNRLGLGQWVQDIEAMDETVLKKSIDSFLATLPEVREMLFKNVLKERENAIQSGVLIKQAFERSQTL